MSNDKAQNLPESCTLTGNDLPVGWIEITLDQILQTLESGSRPKGGVRGIAEGIPSIGGEHIDENGGFRFETIKFVPHNFFKQMKHGHIQPGDILIVKDGATTGKVALVRDDFSYKPAVVNEHVFICRPAEGVHPPFLFYFLFSKEGQDRILENFRGSAQGGINQSFAPGTTVPLAPLAEQKRMVSKVEELLVRVNTTRERLAKVSMILKRFRQAVLSAACSGRLTADWRDKELQTTSYNQVLDENEDLPSSWSWRSIRDIASSKKASIQSGPFGSSLLHSEFQPTGILVIGIDNVLDGKFSFGRQHRISHQKYELLKKYAARPLDVLVTVMATVGRCCVIPSDIETAIITKHVYRITADQSAVNPYYLMQCIRGCPTVLAQIQSETQGVTRPGINGAILKRINIPIPPITEQQEIVRRIESMFKLADAVEKRVAAATARAEKLIQAILAKAFRGELVPTESELARRDGRSYESASELLTRIKSVMTQEFPSGPRRIYTIGHSNHSLQTFVNLLRGSKIEVVVDVRSKPNSQVVPHFNRKPLETSLKVNGFKYLYFGKELGGKPDSKEFYSADGHVLYSSIAKSPPFIQAIERLLKGVRKYRVALLCAEENPLNCHRRLLVGKILQNYDVSLEHIRGNGRVQLEEELLVEEESKRKDDTQLGLFKTEENKEWKFIQSVLPKKAPRHSSEH
jgi:type I restriction enzyme S subunit